jgi:5-hydroxyisourate hydrolase
MSQITSHVLDTNLGKPVANMSVTLFQHNEQQWQLVAQALTDRDGRAKNLLAERQELPVGVYRIHFATEQYFESLTQDCFYPFVDVVFQINTRGEHYHIPLLLSAHGYSTYRGS